MAMDFLSSEQIIDLMKEYVNNHPNGFLLFNPDGFNILRNPKTFDIFNFGVTQPYSLWNDPVLNKAGIVDKLKLMALGRPKDNPLIIQQDLEYNLKELNPDNPEISRFFKLTIQPLYDRKDKLMFYSLVVEETTNAHKIDAELNQKNIQLNKAKIDLENMQKLLIDKYNANISILKKREMDLQYHTVISMISSMLLSNEKDLGVKITNCLRTVGECLKCSGVSIIQQNKDKEKSTLNLCWEWRKSDSKKNIKLFIEELMFNDINLVDRLTPDNIYGTNTIKNSPPKMKEIMTKQKIRSMLYAPILTNGHIWGMILLVDKRAREFPPREISMVLNTAILVGSALKTQSNIEFMQNIFDALSQVDLGIFIIQNDENHIPHLVFVNDTFCQIMERSKEEIMGLENMYEVIDKLILQTKEMSAMLQARQKGMNFPLIYKTKIVTPNGSKEIKISSVLGSLNNRRANFGFISLINDTGLKTLSDLYTEFIEKQKK